MSETKDSTWIICLAFLGSIGIIGSVVFINIGHLLIIGMHIIGIWISGIVIIIYMLIRDEYRIYKKNKAKRLKYERR